MIRQPVSITFDDRGRMWVMQYLQYPNPAGLKPVKVDQYLRTDLRPRPRAAAARGRRGPTASPSCSDPDENGRLPQVEGLRHRAEPRHRLLPRPRRRLRPAAAVPALLPRQERRRRARRRPGGAADRLRHGGHARARQLAPVGAGRLALRRRRAAPVTAKIKNPANPKERRVPAGHLALPPAHEASSSCSPRAAATPAASTSTRHGNVIAGTNWGGFAMLHQVQGGYYVKGFGKHGPLHNPHTYGYFDHVPYTGLQGRPRHLRRHRLPGRRLPAGVPRPVHRRQPALERASTGTTWTPKGSSFTAAPRRRLARRRTTRGSARSTACRARTAASTSPTGTTSGPPTSTRSTTGTRPTAASTSIEYKGTPKLPRRSTCGRRRRPNWSELLKHPNKWWRNEARRLLAERQRHERRSRS